MSKLQEFTTKIERLIYSFKQIFFEKKEEPKPITSLTAKALKAKEEIEEIQPYIDRLNSALSSEDVTNIALTGTYGSGKSTVIRTFQDIYKAEDPNNSFDYLNISLASFKDEIIEEEENETVEKSGKKKQKKKRSKSINKVHFQQSQENFERLLEVSILQQMIYHVRPSTIPDSRFKRIVNLTNTKLTVSALCFVLWLISAFSMWQFDIFSKINPSTWTFSFKNIDFTSLLVISIFLAGLVGIIFKLIRTFGNSRISKINIKGELELGEKVDKSILNQHLDEIIYFFQKTKFNVVVIEDLDRFRDTEIFTKLREINLLLNNSKLIHRKIVFVYAIRDDMFQGHERIKFFDYIIPVIPFINPSNANDKLTELLDKEGLEKVFTQSFIDDVVTFIGDIDMRLLTNILQEYLVYSERLKHELEHDNLLAMVIYKNIHPRDFARLHKNEGDLFDFIKNKENYIEDLIADLDKEIKINQSEITNMEKEKVKNEKELRDIYLFNLLKQLNNPAEIILGDKTVKVNQLSEEDNFHTLMNEQKINYNSFIVNRNYSNNNFSKTRKSLQKSFSDTEKEVNKLHTFNERLELINNLNDNKIEEFKTANELLEKRKEDIKRWDIKQIFQVQDIVDYLGVFKNSDLMRSLLVNGYINENYLDYISLFHEVNITNGDYKFIRRVRSSKISDFSYNLEKLENTVQRINESHFEKIAILNHQIVEFVLKNKKQYKFRYNSLKNLFVSEHQTVIDFIDSYKRNNQTDNRILFKELANIWPSFWNYIVSKNNKFSEKKINEYYQLFVANTALPDLKQLVNIKSFRLHFNKLSNLGDLVEDKDMTKKLKSIATSAKTKFYDITELHSKNKDLYIHVISNDHYEINTTNLLAITTNESISEEKFNCANYTTLRNLENKSTLAYVDKEIELYVTTVLLALEENTKESGKALKSLLNNTGLIVPTRKLILESTTPVFQKLSDFDEIEIKAEILNELAIVPSWQNVMDYFNSYELENLDSILINYLNKEDVYNELIKSNLSSLNDNDDTKKKLALAIIYCDDLGLESHIKLRGCHFSSWTALSIDKLSKDKVESMIDSMFIKLSVHYYDIAASSFFGLHIKLIEKDFSTFIKAPNDYEMDVGDHSSLLKSTKLTDTQKKQFLNSLPEYEITNSNTIANPATEVYVNEKTNDIDYSLLLGLFSKANSDEYRIRLFNLNVNGMHKTEAKNLIQQLGHKYNKLIEPRKRTKLTNNQMHIEFTNNLIRLNILTSNRVGEDGMIKAVVSGKQG